MLQIDLWKRIVIWGLCIIGLFLALPNAFYTRVEGYNDCLLYTSPSPRDVEESRMPSSA